VLVEYYRYHRIQADARAVDGVWNAEVRIRRVFSEDKPHVEVVTCRKPTAEAAEKSAAVVARRWVDRHAGAECP
jgi:hypothetical protein